MERLAGQQPPFAWASRVASLAAQGLAVVGLCIFLGQLASRGAFGTELLGLLLLVAVALAITIPPHVLIALALLVFGAYSVSANHFAFGGVQLYSTDALLAVLLLRGILPRDRIPSPAPLNGVARVLFGIFAVVMIIAGLRGFFSGYGLVSIIRLETPLIYGAGFYLALSRIVRERSFDLDKAVRNLLVVAFGFIAYMAFARLTGSTFETNQTVGRLGIVVTTGGVLRRDYGLSSAFIVYPVLALAAAAYLALQPSAHGLGCDRCRRRDIYDAPDADPSGDLRTLCRARRNCALALRPRTEARRPHTRGHCRLVRADHRRNRRLGREPTHGTWCRRTLPPRPRQAE